MPSRGEPAHSADRLLPRPPAPDRLAWQPPGSQAQRPAAPGAPRLVVAVVYDQLGTATLLRHLDWLDAEGAIRQALERGAFFERSVYPYASTLTAPGHVAIHSGAPPRESGIDGNSLWDAARGRYVSAVDDPGQLVFGRERDGVTVGPGRSRVPTVAQALKAQTGGRARVVSLSIKARSAALSAGRAADLVLWFDAQLGAFTSSPAWSAGRVHALGREPASPAPRLPEWVSRYREAHPVSALLTPWVPLLPEQYAAKLGPDAAPGEGNLRGLGTTFPHRWEQVREPFSVLSCMPQMSEYLVGLAEAAVREHALGQDEVPDLLALSISGTDCAGHYFGPHSWEYVDHLVRADRALGRLLSRLQRSFALATLITSDHGVAPLPENSPAPNGRLETARVRHELEQALSAKFGAGPWVTTVHHPFVHLTDKARQPARRDAVRAAALAVLRRMPGLRDAFPLSDVRGWQHDPDPLRRALALGVAPENAADLLYLALPHHPFALGDTPGGGTNHGSPYAYDREVPVLAWGPGVPPLRRSDPVDQLRVAATLSRLLGIAPPAAAVPEPLF